MLSAAHASAARAQVSAVASPPPASPAPEPPPPAEPLACDAAGPEAYLAAARAHFVAGQALVDQSNWTEAERELALALSYFDSPNARFLMAAALAGEGRYDEAYNAYENTIELASRCAQADQTRGRNGRYEQTVADALHERDALTSRVSLLGVRVQDDAPRAMELRVNGRSLPRSVWGRLRAYPPGDARVTAEATSFERFVRTPSLDPRQAQWVDVALSPVVRPVPARAPGNPALAGGLVVGGTGLVTTVAGVAAYVSGRGTFASLQRQCAGGCPATAEFRAQIEGGRTIETAGIAMFWVGAGLTVTGAIVAIVSSAGHRGAAAPIERAGVHLSPSPGGVVIHGSF
ncbi:MAG: hypothetical protein WCJ30_05325 [Deltaproteobacteria bacterium]